ncbi:MAG: efflux transporter outer membrane subunit [Sphingomonas sp.]|uniref:efflux transporter outer membrane subunit n=1 Tax=Sphingomonas sp. TaxID=28214 RepID=UPI0025E83543|nr:efflux transporter outer membrane subunit [Sphingomonas sp.]MBY0283578.1 efflux transporter outer membrane subunit [Sphingomonas sp.]
MWRSHRLTVPGFALLLASCAVGPNYRPPETKVLAVPPGYTTPAPNGAVPDLQRWWVNFNDPQLDLIVDLALKDNLDIAQAVSRLRQARESLIQSRASLFPTVNANASYSRNINIRGRTFGQITNAGIVNENYALSGDVSYTADIFGGVRRGVEAGRASYESSGYNLAQVQATIASEVARNYILARAAQAGVSIARGSLAIQQDNLEIAGFRVQAGLVSSLDAEQARAQRAQTAANVPSLEQQYEQATNRLGVLTGQAPGALKAQLAATAPIPQGPGAVPVGLPADVIRLRPDVRAAERNLAAATAQIGVAKANLLPQLTLAGSISSNATSINALTDIITGRVFGQLAQTIFDAGRGRSVVRARRAQAEEAFAAYKASVLGALEDVENALTALATAQARQREFEIAADASSNAAILARSQYRAGLTDITTLNNTEVSLLSAQSGLNTARSDQAQALVQLYLALGGGWNASAPPPTAEPLKAGDGQPTPRATQ